MTELIVKSDLQSLPNKNQCGRGRKRMRPRLVVAGLLGTVFLLAFFCFGHSIDEDAAVLQRDSNQWDVQGASRQLLESKGTSRNCTPQAIEQFPTDLFSDAQRRKGVVLLHVFMVIYCFIGLAFVCDEFFVPCLERMCEILNLSQDVAGATFMAAGSSAPELATAIFGVVVAQDDIGLSSVVGSAVYNVTFVIAVCGFAVPCGGYVLLNWYSLARDTIYYAICILLLTWFISDEMIYWYEALVLLIFYVIYITLMVFNPRMSVWCTEKCSRWLPAHIPQIGNSGVVDGDAIAINSRHPYGKLDDNTKGSCDNFEPANAEYSENQPVKSGNWSPRDVGDAEAADESQQNSAESEWLLAWPQGTFNIICHVFLLPLKVLTFFTIPDCRRPRFRRFFILTFLLSCIWLAILAYVMIWMVTVIGHTLRIPDSVMGLTFVAAGSSVPDAIASFLVLREGKGDMAVSNAVGSNVFDILICMGMPWFFMTLRVGGPVPVFSRGLFYSSVTLLSTVFLLLITAHTNKWRLNCRLGIILMIFYCLFVCLSILYELNLFGYVHPPECETVY